MKANRIKPYMAFVKGSITNTFAYKFSVYGWIIGDVIQLIILCSVWSAVFRSSETEVINGFTRNSMLTYLIIGRVVSQLVFATNSFFILGFDIRDGNIAINLTKPLDYRHRLFAQGVGYFISIFFMVFLPICLVGLIGLHFIIDTDIPTLINIFLFLVSAFLAFIIVDCFNFLIGELAFYTGALFGVMLLKDAVFGFLSGSLIPLNFFPETAQKILRVLPFSSIVETPNYVLLGYYSLNEALIKLAIQLGWAVALYFISWGSYKLISKRVISVGG